MCTFNGSRFKSLKRQTLSRYLRFQISDMKKLLLVFILISILGACEKATKNTMTINGNIAGLKKGMLYLQHLKDSTLTNIDSIALKGDGNFTFNHEVESPEIFYLYLDKADNNTINDRITFFGEPGLIYIKTAWNTVDTKSEVSGSKSQDKLSEFNAMITKFNTRDIEIFQSSLLPEIKENKSKLDSLKIISEKNFVSRYKYTTNFALTNTDSFIAPYVALTEISDANPKYLDSIYNNLTEEVAESKYGKALKEHLKTLNK